MIYTEQDLADCPLLVNWTIQAGARGGPPMLAGMHAFHEGQRLALDEVLAVDTMLRWAMTMRGGYRLSGPGTWGPAEAGYGTEKKDE